MTPEEIAQKLTRAGRRALLRLRDGWGYGVEELRTYGLAPPDGAWRLTDLGRAVADVVAKQTAQGATGGA